MNPAKELTDQNPTGASTTKKMRGRIIRGGKKFANKMDEEQDGVGVCRRPIQGRGIRGV